jgi:hypothetical protein
MKNFKLVAAAAAAALVALLVPAAASAAPTPVQLTDFSPARTPDLAGQKHATAVNPRNGRQLVFGFFGDDEGAYLAANVYTPSGAPIGGEHVFLDGTGTTSNQSFGAAYNPVTGGWIVTWLDTDAKTYTVQMLKASGAAQGSARTLVTSPDINCCGSSDIAWDSRKKQFLVAWSYYSNTGETTPDGSPTGRFVKPNGIPVAGGSFRLLSNVSQFSLWNDYHQLALEYSPRHNSFGLLTKARNVSVSANWRPYFQRLNSKGRPAGSAKNLTPLPAPGSNVGNVDLAYSAKSDQYAAIWGETDGSENPIYVQRLKGSTGAVVGAPVLQGLPTGATINRYRTKIAAGPSGFYAVSTFDNSDSGGQPGIGGFKIGANGSTVGEPVWLWTDAAGPAYRPQVTFDRVSCRFVVTYVGDADGSGPSAAYQLFESRVSTTGCKKPKR